MSLITVLIYIVIAETVPQIMECDEFSRKLITEIRPGWKSRNNRIESRHKTNIRKKVSFSLKQLTFYYASVSFI